MFRAVGARVGGAGRGRLVLYGDIPSGVGYKSIAAGFRRPGTQLGSGVVVVGRMAAAGGFAGATITEWTGWGALGRTGSHC